MSKKPSGQTQAVRAALETDEQFGAVVPPLHLSSNFTFEGYGKPRKYDYTRTANPTRDALAETIADLEGGAGGTVTSTGMSAILLAFQLLNPEDLVIAPVDCYGGTFRLLNFYAGRGLFNVEFIDQTDGAELDRAVGLKPKMIWVETPTNPLLRVIDLEAMSARAKQVGAWLAVDNTFLSPALQRPIDFGADLVVHSTTKYLNGHSDVVGGAVVAATEELHEQFQYAGNALGLSGAPFDSFLTLRGIRTLHVRLRQHQENAAALAEMLEAHAKVARVHYPGLVSHPGHEIAKRQQKGFGGMLSIDLAGGEEAARTFLEHIELFSLAESLGGVESLIAHPWSMTHVVVDEASKKKAGIGPGLLRLSIGIEATEDLLADVETALAKI
ncbi:MAG: cystathionine gamma-synthase [Gammaproteobacteria bacterium]